MQAAHTALGACCTCMPARIAAPHAERSSYSDKINHIYAPVVYVAACALRMKPEHLQQRLPRPARQRLLPVAVPRRVLVPLAALAAVPRWRPLAALRRGFVPRQGLRLATRAAGRVRQRAREQRLGPPRRLRGGGLGLIAARLQSHDAVSARSQPRQLMIRT